MCFGRVLRDQEAKDQIDTKAIVGVVIQRMLEAHEGANTAFDTAHATVRDGDAVAQTGAAEFFACGKAVEDVCGINAGSALAKQACEVFEDLLLAGVSAARDHAVGAQDFVELHLKILPTF